jgi:phosphoribosyl 1,2-cyclic phosphodiesterase
MKPSDRSLRSLDVRFWGVRGSIPVPGKNTTRFGGNTSCVEIRYGSQVLVLDAGTGIRALGAALLSEYGSAPMELDVLLSHLHWDHIQGFPFFQPLYEPGNRIRVFGPAAGRMSLRAAFHRQMQSPWFPVDLRRLPSRPTFCEAESRSFKIGAFQVTPIRVNHPDGCLGYRLSAPGASVAYLPDCELSKRLPRQPRPVLLDRDLKSFVRGVDLLILDSQYDISEYPRHAGWGHGCLEDMVALACRARVKQLQLFHHDPDHGDRIIAQRLRRAREIARSLGSSLHVEAAREGATVVLPAAL